MIYFLSGIVVGLLLGVGGIFLILHISDLNDMRQARIDAEIDELHRK